MEGKSSPTYSRDWNRNCQVVIMGYEQLKNIIDSNREQAELEKREETTRCPVCDYLLKENSKGEKACIICGWFGR